MPAKAASTASARAERLSFACRSAHSSPNTAAASFSVRSLGTRFHRLVGARPDQRGGVGLEPRDRGLELVVEREARADDLGAHALELLADRIGMPVSCACAACALGALRPPLIIGGRTSGGAFASGSVSPPVARDQLHAPSPGASLAGAYVLEATTAAPERGWTQSGIRLPAAKRPPGAQLAYERTEPTVGAARCLRAGSHRNGTGRLLRRHITDGRRRRPLTLSFFLPLSVLLLFRRLVVISPLVVLSRRPAAGLQ